MNLIQIKNQPALKFLFNIHWLNEETRQIQPVQWKSQRSTIYKEQNIEMNYQMVTKTSFYWEWSKIHLHFNGQELFCIVSVIYNLESCRLDPIKSESDNTKGVL